MESRKRSISPWLEAEERKEEEVPNKRMSTRGRTVAATPEPPTYRCSSWENAMAVEEIGHLHSEAPTTSSLSQANEQEARLRRHRDRIGACDDQGAREPGDDFILAIHFSSFSLESQEKEHAKRYITQHIIRANVPGSGNMYLRAVKARVLFLGGFLARE